MKRVFMKRGRMKRGRMKRKYAMLLGNILMVIGLIAMVIGILLAVASYSPQLAFVADYSGSGLVAIFIGAFIWLAGAKLSGYERIEDRYWAIRYTGK